MLIRKYQPADCREIVELFYNTVHKVNIKDYSQEQVNAWADGAVDLAAWNKSLLEHLSLVAEERGLIIGFGDIDQTGYLDRLFVHSDYQGRGVASAICDGLEQAVAGKIITHASLTAKPFFKKRGYRVVRGQMVKRHGVWLENFLMEKAKKTLDCTPAG